MSFRLKPDVAAQLVSKLTDEGPACSNGKRLQWDGLCDVHGRPAYRGKVAGGKWIPAAKQYYEQVIKCGPVEDGWIVIHDCGDEQCFACLREIDEHEQAQRIEKCREDAYRMLREGKRPIDIARLTGIPQAHLEYKLKNGG